MAIDDYDYGYDYGMERGQREIERERQKARRERQKKEIDKISNAIPSDVLCGIKIYKLPDVEVLWLKAIYPLAPFLILSKGGGVKFKGPGDIAQELFKKYSGYWFATDGRGDPSATVEMTATDISHEEVLSLIKKFFEK